MKIIHEHKIKWILIIVVSVLMLGVTFEYKYLFNKNPCWFYRGSSGNPSSIGAAGVYDKCLMPNAEQFMFSDSCSNSSMPTDNQMPTCMEQDNKFNYYRHLFGIFNILGYILLGIVFVYILIDIYRFGDNSGYIKFFKKIFDSAEKK